MNANYIYEVFETTSKNGDPDLFIGLAKLKVEKPIPAGMTEKELCEFIGRHYDELVKAYAKHDRAVFQAAVEACEARDQEAKG